MTIRGAVRGAAARLCPSPLVYLSQSLNQGVGLPALPRAGYRVRMAPRERRFSTRTSRLIREPARDTVTVNETGGLNILLRPPASSMRLNARSAPHRSPTRNDMCETRL